MTTPAVRPDLRTYQLFIDGELSEIETYVEVGNISPGRYTDFDPGLLTWRCLTIHAVNRYNPKYLDRARQFLSRVDGRYPFDKLVSDSFPLDSVEATIDQSRQKSVGRAAIQPDLS